MILLPIQLTDTDIVYHILNPIYVSYICNKEYALLIRHTQAIYYRWSSVMFIPHCKYSEKLVLKLMLSDSVVFQKRNFLEIKDYCLIIICIIKL